MGKGKLCSSSVLLTTAAGVAACLATTDADAATRLGIVKKNGAVVTSGNAQFAYGNILSLCDAAGAAVKAKFRFNGVSFTHVTFLSYAYVAVGGLATANLRTFSAGQTLPLAGSPAYVGFGFWPTNVDGYYFAVRIGAAAPYTYGWVHVVSSTKDGLPVTIDSWGYNDVAGQPIKTLAESVKTKRLTLSDGSVRLHWSNDNEEGVASYAAQVERNGEWTTFGTWPKGEGRYSVKSPETSARCRLVVESIDGVVSTFLF